MKNSKEQTTQNKSSQSKTVQNKSPQSKPSAARSGNTSAKSTGGRCCSKSSKGAQE